MIEQILPVSFYCIIFVKKEGLLSEKPELLKLYIHYFKDRNEKEHVIRITCVCPLRVSNL